MLKPLSVMSFMVLVALLFAAAPNSLAQGQEKGGKKCSDGIDNDGDGLVDGDDPDCGGDPGDPGDPPTIGPDHVIAFQQSGGKARNSLVLMKEDGSDRVTLVGEARGVENYNPSWSPDGDWLVFDRWIADNGPSRNRTDEELNVVAADGAVSYHLFEGVAFDGVIADRPQWSPNPEWIAYTNIENIAGVWERSFGLVQLKDLSTDTGAPPPQVLGPYTLNLAPFVLAGWSVWAPAPSRRVAVLGWSDASLQEVDILMFDVDLPGEMGIGSPMIDWSTVSTLRGVYRSRPDGLPSLEFAPGLEDHAWAKAHSNWMAVTFNDSSPRGIWFVDVTGRCDPVNLTKDPLANARMPDWSPNDDQIVFHVDDQGLFAVDLVDDGECVTDASGPWRSLGDGTEPAWRDDLPTVP